MNTEIVFVFQDASEGCFLAHPAGASIFNEAETLPELREGVRVVAGLPERYLTVPAYSSLEVGSLDDVAKQRGFGRHKLLTRLVPQ